jgi:hypothetical protein
MIITLGCSNVLSNGHINIDSGIFGVLDEKVVRVKTDTIIPASENTSCKCRRSARCNINCHHAIYGINSIGKISYRNINKRI